VQLLLPNRTVPQVLVWLNGPEAEMLLIVMAVLCELV